MRGFGCFVQDGCAHKGACEDVEHCIEGARVPMACHVCHKSMRFDGFTSEGGECWSCQSCAPAPVVETANPKDIAGRCVAGVDASPKSETVCLMPDGCFQGRECMQAKHCVGWERIAARRRQAVPALPADRATRKDTPVWSGFINYFPLAIAAVAQLSKSANNVHNPGEPLHWSKEQSNDHKDCMGRHLIEINEYDREPDHDYHYLHAVKNAWRAMAHLQILLETGRAPRVKKGELP